MGRMAALRSLILALALGLVACLKPESERMVLKLLTRASNNGTAAIAAADNASRIVTSGLESALVDLVKGIDHLDCVAKKNCPKAAHADTVRPFEHEGNMYPPVYPREEETIAVVPEEMAVVKKMRARYVKQMQGLKAYRKGLDAEIMAHAASNTDLRKQIKGLKVEDEEKALEGAMAASMVKQEIEKMRRIVSGLGMTKCGIDGCGLTAGGKVKVKKVKPEMNKGKVNDKPTESEYQQLTKRLVVKEVQTEKAEINQKDADKEASATMAAAEKAVA